MAPYSLAGIVHDPSTNTLVHLEDLRQAGYPEVEIMDVLKIPVIPPKDLVFEFIGRCGDAIVVVSPIM
jgi:hypothetical protein